MTAVAAYEEKEGERMREELRAIPDVTVWGAAAQRTATRPWGVV